MDVDRRNRRLTLRWRKTLAAVDDDRVPTSGASPMDTDRPMAVGGSFSTSIPPVALERVGDAGNMADCDREGTTNSLGGPGRTWPWSDGLGDVGTLRRSRLRGDALIENAPHDQGPLRLH